MTYGGGGDITRKSQYDRMTITRRTIEIGIVGAVDEVVVQRFPHVLALIKHCRIDDHIIITLKILKHILHCQSIYYKRDNSQDCFGAPAIYVVHIYIYIYICMYISLMRFIALTFQ